MRSQHWSGLLSWIILSFLISTGLVSQALASEASVLDVVVVANEDGTYGFNVTISHNDEGWTHYANKWEVLTPEGKVIGTRTLFHPHVNEQPFMRTLGRVEIPIGVTEVTIRAYDTVSGPGSRTMTVQLPPRK
ncbi:MAG: hypothetical protein WD075_03935 [Rhodospirillales bacterium]